MSRINTNIPSLIASRVLTTQNTTLAQSLTRLSTGLRINRGSDDPSGLIASEALRSERTAIDAAVTNAERASNVLSVAEGGLQEISSLLLSLEDLVDRSANEAGLSDDEVTANQLEIDSILTTINRIANSTEFNGKKLLNGTLAYTTSGINSTNLAQVQITGARLPDTGTRSVVVQVTASAQTARLNLVAGGGTGLSSNGLLTPTNNVTIEVGGLFGTETLSFAGGTANSAVRNAVNSFSDLTGVSASLSGQSIRFYSRDYGLEAFVSVQATSGTFTVSGGSSATRDEGRDATVLINGIQGATKGLSTGINSSALSVNLILGTAFGTALGSTTFYIKGGGADFAISPSLELAGRESIGIDAVTTGSLGNRNVGFISTLGSGQTNSLINKRFTQAQRVIRSAIDLVSGLRGRLGAFQRNTLESAASALEVAYENTSAAESAIRDTDFAQETSQLTRSQILVAAAGQVLQIANAAPQSVLSLLQG